MATLSLRGLRKSYGGVEVIKGIDLDIADRDLVVFVGPSGCGKSTLLRMIAGLEAITAATSRSTASASTMWVRRIAGWRWSSSPTRCTRT